MNAICSYEAEYIVSSFLRDLPIIREKTFIVSTIKHTFQNAGIWPVDWLDRTVGLGPDRTRLLNQQSGPKIKDQTVKQSPFLVRTGLKLL